MAIILTDGFTAFPRRPLYNQGEKIQVVKAVSTIATGANDGDTIILARNLSLSSVVTRLMLPKGLTAITNSTDSDIGFYRSDGDGIGVVIDKDILVDGIDLTSALDYATDILGLNVSGFDETLTIGGLLGLQEDTAYSGGVHLVLTLNTAGSGAGTVDMDIHVSMAG